MGRGPKPEKGKAKPAAPRTSRKNGAGVRDLEKRLAEAQEQQKATSEILRVISSSPTDVQPVFEAIAANAVRLCGAVNSAVFRFDGKLIHLATSHNIPGDILAPFQRLFPATLDSPTVTARAISSRATVHVEDLSKEYENTPVVQAGYRTVLSVPMMREGVPIGAVNVARMEVQPFSPNQVALLQTFADQAVIAIENVRLFKELQTSNRDLTTALEQQTATSEILRVISASPIDVQPVFDEIARSAAQLCQAAGCVVTRFDGEQLHVAAAHTPVAEFVQFFRTRFPMAPDRSTGAGRAVLDGTVVHIANTVEDPEYGDPEVRRQAQPRSVLATPLLREGQPIGAIVMGGREAGRFSDKQVALLQTFADQAVIAIENVRLFKELQEKNEALTQAHAQVTEALEQQTATSEILRTIAHSQTDVQPVFDTIVHSAVRLLRGYSGTLTRVAGGQIELAAFTSTDADADTALRASYPRSLESEGTLVMAIRERVPLNVAAAQTDPRLPQVQRTFARVRGFQSLAAVPLLHHDEAVGAILVTRREPGGFTADEIALLQIFADQAVIAIENVRLFTELQEKNQALTLAHAQVSEALEQQTATSDILRVISTSPTDLQPVLEAVAKSAARFCGADDAIILQLDGEHLRAAAHQGPIPVDFNVPVPCVPGTVGGRTVLERRAIHVTDLQAETQEFPEGSALARHFGHRTTLGVPLLREGTAIGTIQLRRLEANRFTDKQTALLQTFADQAVIAIENVRLFKELQARNQELTVALAQQTATSEVLAVISGAQTDVRPVFEAIVRSARRLCDASYSSVYRLDGQLVHLVAHNHQTPEAAETFRSAWPMPLSGDSFVVRAIRENAVIHTDMQEDPTTSAALLTRAKAVGHRRILVVPMVREGQPIGGIRVSRAEATSFADHHIALLQTFADQAVIAIENVRLFTELEASNREIAEKSRQIEVASQHKSEFLANMSHELRTPLNAIIGFSEVLSEKMFGELNEKQEEYSKDIHASGQHLLSLINDILDLSKIEAGRMELELSDFHLPTALDSALTLVRERAGRRSIALHLSVDERLGQIQADERKVRQVVLNLLSNAIKFTPEGGRIEVAAMPKDGFVEVSVSDTGVGIAPEDQEAVFEEFRQVGTADKKVEGTGLGLTLCRKFVELHGGRIWVKSELGKGSTFTFTIPVRRGQ